MTNGERELYVYTPPGYDRAKTYPVLYLVGGSGELPSNWIYDGRVNFIMDNLLAEGKAVPMVIAIPNNQVVHRNNPRHVELTFKLFEAELRQHVIPLVEREYSVRRDPEGRAPPGSVHGRPPHDVRRVQRARPVRLLRRAQRWRCGQREVARQVPERSRRQQQGGLPLRRPGHDGSGGTHGRSAASRCTRRCSSTTIKHEYYVGGHGGHDWATWRHLCTRGACPASGGRHFSQRPRPPR
ncbi:MAG: alpha/beta hydrolase-fold protein [Marinilabiliales bacterium]|nr:alpha/beta hydrolase-fold protein [Marinilabiliales bacterium]